MTHRRDFLKTSLLVTGGLALGARTVQAEGLPKLTGVIYTAENPGQWDKKVGSHAPQVKVENGQVTISVKHPMSAEHFIVRQTLVTADGTMLGSKTFTPADAEPVSTHSLPEGAKGIFYATSFCNQHDLWVTSFTV